ncbi:MAG: ester cyclase [Gaiellaceae bacterium]
MSEANRQLILRFYEEALNERRLDAIDEVVSPDFVFHAAAEPEPVRGPEGFRAFFERAFVTFPDLRVTVEDVVADEDKVAVRVTLVGTHLGEFQGIPPSGNRVSMAEHVICHLENGKFTEVWQQFDAVGGLQQMGVLPPPGTGPLGMIASFFRNFARGAMYQLRSRRR